MTFTRRIVTMWTALNRCLDGWWHCHWIAFILIGVLIVLRLPNFTEPYWYGDEGIYLTIGQSLRSGERLYAEIIDHKTPLIYYLAMVPNQLAFRWLLMGWMIVTTLAFYRLSRTFFESNWTRLVAGLLFVLATTLPRLEGNIPNGELFVMGFVIVGLYLISQTQWWQTWLAVPGQVSKHQHLFLLLGGSLLSLGILTKVPGLFDVISVGWAMWLYLLRFPVKMKSLLSKIVQLITPTWWLGLGILLPIVISIVYFIARGSGQAYLDFGLLYNFRYAGSWALPFTQPWLLWLFTLPGKTLVLATVLVFLSVLQRWVQPKWLWLSGWFGLAMFASLLSNRPYPHYFLQLIPPLAFLLGAVIEVWTRRLPTHPSPNRLLNQGAVTGLVLGAVALTLGIWQLIGVWFYPTLSYYQRWWLLVTRQMSPHEYRQSFDELMADSYQAAAVIRTSENPYLFIWGTNPMLYALTQKIPAGRFTVAFHIKDFDAYGETLTAVTSRQPEFIVVMNDDRDSFPALNHYLMENYTPNHTFENFVVWARLLEAESL